MLPSKHACFCGPQRSKPAGGSRQTVLSSIMHLTACTTLHNCSITAQPCTIFYLLLPSRSLPLPLPRGNIATWLASLVCAAAAHGRGVDLPVLLPRSPLHFKWWCQADTSTPFFMRMFHAWSQRRTLSMKDVEVSTSFQKPSPIGCGYFRKCLYVSPHTHPNVRVNGRRSRMQNNMNNNKHIRFVSERGQHTKHLHACARWESRSRL